MHFNSEVKIHRKSIFEISETEKNLINSFIQQHSGLIFHETNFNEIVSEIFHTRLSYFLAYIGNNLVGICPIHSLKKGFLINSFSNNGSFEIPYGGWVFRSEFVSLKKLWYNMPIRINESLTYWTSFMTSIPETLMKKSKSFQTGLVNLKKTEKELFDDLIHSKRRNMIRKAEKSEITIKKFDAEGLPLYTELMHGMHAKVGIKEVPSDYYKNILDFYFKKEMALLMIAFLDNNPISGVLLVGNKNVVHYWQGASVGNTPNLGQGELLQWESIKWAKNYGANYYDLCVIEPERLPHIARFKLGFTKDLIPFYCMGKKSLFYRSLNKTQNVFRA